MSANKNTGAQLTEALFLFEAQSVNRVMWWRCLLKVHRDIQTLLLRNVIPDPFPIDLERTSVVKRKELVHCDS